MDTVKSAIAVSMAIAGVLAMAPSQLVATPMIGTALTTNGLPDAVAVTSTGAIVQSADLRLVPGDALSPRCTPAPSTKNRPLDEADVLALLTEIQWDLAKFGTGSLAPTASKFADRRELNLVLGVNAMPAGELRPGGATGPNDIDATWAVTSPSALGSTTAFMENILLLVDITVRSDARHCSV